MGQTSSFTYDGYGRLRTATDAEGHTTTYDYDALDRLTKTTYPDATYEETVYNRLDAERIRDRLGRWSHVFRDALRRVVATKDPLGQTVTQEWCTCGSLDKLTDANGHSTAWERDGQGRITKEHRSNGTDTAWIYEATSSRVKQVRDAKNQEINYGYFADGMRRQVSYPNALVPTATVDFTYDAVYRRLLTVTDGTGTTTFGYHSVALPPALGAGQIAFVDGPIAGSTDRISYSYDELGRLLARTIDGSSSTRAYDALGRVESRTNSLGAFAYSYAGTSGRLSSVTYPNGQTTTYGYLPATGDFRLQEIANRVAGGALLSKFRYSYDVAGNVTTWRQESDVSTPQVYDLEYDATEQLLSATLRTTDPAPVTVRRYRYGFDKTGNRTVEQIDDSATAAAHNEVNEVTGQQSGGALVFRGTLSEAAVVTVQGTPATVAADNQFDSRAQVGEGQNQVVVAATDPSGNTRTNTYQVTVGGTTKTFTYDVNGNLVSDGARTLAWDAEDRLVSVVQGTHRSEFVYDGLGHRTRVIEKEGGTVTSDRRFVWCGNQICEERDGTGAVVTKRVFAQGMEESGALYYFTRDHLGSVREMTDAVGAVRARYSYDPYGRATKVAGDKEAPFGFAGYSPHAESGLYLTLYRAYDPSLGRWLTGDPLGLRDGPNLYAYVGNNPVRWIDHFGLMKLPPNPNGLPPGWTPDPSHQNPNGQRFRNPNGDFLDWHPAKPDAPPNQWKGRDHWHHNGDKEHLRPGDEVPDAPVPQPDPQPTPNPQPAPPPPGFDPETETERRVTPDFCPVVQCPEKLVPVLVGATGIIVWKLAKTCGCTAVGGPGLGAACLVTP